MPSVERCLAGHTADPDVVGPGEVLLVVEDDEVALIFIEGVQLVLWKAGDADTGR